jgi:hypothetical protein
MCATTATRAQSVSDASFEDVRLGHLAHDMRHAVTWQSMASLWQPMSWWSMQQDTGRRDRSPWQVYEELSGWAGWRLMPVPIGMPVFVLSSVPWLPHSALFGHWGVPGDMHDLPCVTPVPEPATTTLALAGGLALWAVRRRRHPR